MLRQAEKTLSIDKFQVTLRPMTEADLPALEWDGEYAHFRRVYAQHYQSMRRGTTLIWVAETDGGAVIGQLFLLLYSQQREVADGIHRAYIFSFRIKPSYRNMGVGTAMLNLAEAELIKRGFTEIRMNVSRENQAAQRLYKRLGYRVIGSDPGFWKYQDQFGNWQTIKEPAWKMLKFLNTNQKFS